MKYITCLSVRPSARLSLRPVIHRPFAIFVFVLISSVGFQRRDAFIPHWGPVKIICLSVPLSLCLLGCLHRFWANIHVACNCEQCMRPQATVSNPLSVSKICPSVRPVIRRPFCSFCICINFQFGGPACRNAFILIKFQISKSQTLNFYKSEI